MYCWICSDIIFKEYYLLPSDEEIESDINNYEIKKVGIFTFFYHILCEACLNTYLRNYPFNFKKLMRRELGLK